MVHPSKPSSRAESVDEDTIVVKQDPAPPAGRELEMGFLRSGGAIKDERVVSATNSPSLLPSKLKSSRSSSSTSIKSRATSESSVEKREVKDNAGGGTSLKMEPGQPPKMARSVSHKMKSRPTPLFDELPDATMEAKSSFSVIEACTYSNKFLGYAEHAMECDCAEEWGKRQPLQLQRAFVEGNTAD